MKEYKYDAYASCDEQYPMDIYSSSFHAKNDFLPIVSASGSLSGPWGEGGGDVIGDGFNGVPTDLRICFYSNVEDKFYEGEFDLPSEEIEKLLQQENTDPFYQDKTYDDTQSGKELKYMKYNQIIASVSLGGEVTVWLGSSQQSRQQKLIATYFAKETPNVKWQDIFDYSSREESLRYNMEELFSEKVKQEIKSQTLPLELWSTFKEKYNWRFKLEGENGENLNEIYIKMINAESECIYYNDPLLNNDSYKQRAIPYNIELFWEDTSGKKYSSWIVLREDIKYYLQLYKSVIAKNVNPQDFLEEEIYRVFKSFDKNKPIDILFKINQNNTELKIVLKQEKKEVVLSKVVAKVFKEK